MTELAQSNTIILIVALFIGLVVGWWLFRRSRKTSVRIDTDTSQRSGLASTPPVSPYRAAAATPAQADTHEGNSVIDEGAAAATDVYGEILGAEAHRELPGAEGPPDRLHMMKGVGPKFVAKLNEAGITRFDQLASLTPGEVASLDERMGAFKGRLLRDRIIEQASYLARNDHEGFESSFGKLGG